MAEEPLKSVWRTMHARCYKPKHSRYHIYGGRGISICEAWHSYDTFSNWAYGAGYAKGRQIDRVDTDGEYSPNNCRWVTSKDNNRNRRNNRLIKFDGVTKTLADWADDPKCVVPYAVLWERLKDGATFEEALTKPARRKGGYRVVSAWGEEKSITEWAKDPRCPGVKLATLWKRVNDGWSTEAAISTPTRGRN